MPTGRGEILLEDREVWRQTARGSRAAPAAPRGHSRDLMARPSETLSVAGREVTVSNPHKVYFPERGYTKLQLVEYYLAVADGALRGAGGRPMALKRFVDGAAGQPFFQKRAPESRPDWIETVELSFPSGRTADEIVIRDAAQLAWIVNLGCIDLNPHPVRAEDLDHPDELRVDLDPIPGVPWDHVRRVALVVRESLVGPGPDGLAQDIRVAGHPHQRAHRAALDVPAGAPRGAGPGARRRAACPGAGHQPLVEGGAPRRVHRLQPERQGPHGRLRLLRAPDARRAGVHAAALGGRARLRDGGLHAGDGARPVSRRAGDAADGIDDAVGSLEALLELSARHEAEGLGDAPWPPHYAKPEGEPPRVAPSKQRRPTSEYGPSAAPRPRRPAAARRWLATDAHGPAPTSIPVVEIARAEYKEQALEGLERWKARHPEVVPHLEPADVLVDSMRGRSTAWYRVRVNLIHVPAADRPAQEAAGGRLRPVGRVRVAGPVRASRACSQEADDARAGLSAAGPPSRGREPPRWRRDTRVRLLLAVTCFTRKWRTAEEQAQEDDRRRTPGTRSTGISVLAEVDGPAVHDDRLGVRGSGCRGRRPRCPGGRAAGPGTGPSPGGRRRRPR